MLTSGRLVGDTMSLLVERERVLNEDGRHAIVLTCLPRWPARPACRRLDGAPRGPTRPTRPRTALRLHGRRSGGGDGTARNLSSLHFCSTRGRTGVRPVEHDRRRAGSCSTSCTTSRGPPRRRAPTWLRGFCPAGTRAVSSADLRTSAAPITADLGPGADPGRLLDACDQRRRGRGLVSAVSFVYAGGSGKLGEPRRPARRIQRWRAVAVQALEFFRSFDTEAPAALASFA